MALVSQCDTGSGGQPCSTHPADNGAVDYVCGDYTGCDTGGTRSTTFAHQNQTVLITAVTNNGGGSYTFTISPGLYMPNWSTSLGAQMTWNNLANQVDGIGMEDLTVLSPTNSQNFLIQMARAYASWMKGVRILGTGASFPLKVSASKNVLLANNYCASEISLAQYSACFSVDTSADFLTINNMTAQAIPTEYDGGNSGGVTAYNFGRDAFTPYAEDEWSFDHAAYSAFDLYEGNESGGMTEDSIWGTHSLNTYMRNYIVGYDSPYAGGAVNARGLAISDWQRGENIIGNVIGSSQITSYQGTGFNTALQISTGDSLVATTMMRWGNVTNITQSSDTPANSGVRFVSSEVPSSLSAPNTAWQNAVPGSHDMPCSFYFSGYTGTGPCAPKYSGGTGFSWWKVCTTWTTFPTSCSATQLQPFPLAGPELASGPYVNGFAYDNPAAIAWLDLPVDATYQNSYTITGSSWSSGTETLTISGLPTFNCGGSAPCILLGAFQLSGVNSACTTGATINANNEILMTNSTSTTVQYALSSNPGVACTGTMKFPDIRQFDERVYETDSGGTSYTWAVTATNGSLTGTNCGNGSYTSGTTIGACTAVPNTGYGFSSWSAVSGSAACSGATNPCPSFSITANSAATANFTINSWILSTATAGSGSGTITGCAGTVNYGVGYSCTVTPSTGSTLTSVSGCGGSGTTTYTGTMPNSNCAVTATFTINTYTLGVTAINGSVSGSNCAPGTYNYNTAIGPCTGTANTGYTFTGWSGTGSCSGASGTGTASCTLTANSTLVATFTANTLAEPRIILMLF